MQLLFPVFVALKPDNTFKRGNTTFDQVHDKLLSLEDESIQFRDCKSKLDNEIPTFGKLLDEYTSNLKVLSKQRTIYPG